ncbi:hypothetical protein DYB32_005869 [Aphanomyces invadans]|uniref:CSC1/OSCA1-like cytosolic domain-containing protein n=1 Tax=Aphanomyces invadans TaxID=157072 RepID=A0A3R6Z2R4_9STRA|nr:hypothetical protein DYB32_005869 [Aphanomyces invadans]
MVEKAKRRARVERLGAGKSFFNVTMDDIGDLGVGIRLYFMLTKYTSMLFVVMSLCAAPSAGNLIQGKRIACLSGRRVVIHYFGHGVTEATKDPLGLNYLSLANEGINPEYVPANCTSMGGTMDCSLRTIDTPLTTSPKMGAYIATICDCTYSLVFVAYIVFMSHRCRAIVAAHAKDNITPAKYAVYVRGFPRDATEAEIMAHFSALYDLSQPAQYFPMWLGCFGRRRRRRPGDASRSKRSFEPVADVSHVDGNDLYMQSWVAQVSIARPIGTFLRLFLALETLTQKIAMLEATIAEYKTHPRRFHKRLPRAQLELAALQTQLETKTSNMTALRTQGIQRLHECECAFVVFNHVESQQQCLADYRTSHSWWKRWFQPTALRFRGMHALKVSAAPEPSNIVWENLETSAVERFARRSLTNVVTFVLLIVSCAIISLAQGYVLATALTSIDYSCCVCRWPSAQQTFNKPGPANICAKILDVYQGPSYDGAADDWTLHWNASVVCPVAGSFEITYNQSATPFPATVPTFNDVAGPSANLTRCTSGCFTPGLTTCGTLPCFTTDYNYTATTNRAVDNACESYDSSSIVLCYCKPKLEAYIALDGLYHGPKKLWQVEVPCREYITAFLTKNGLLVAAAVTVILVNTALRGVFYAFGGFERHSSESNTAAAVVVKLFFAQWINTAVIVLLVNAQLGNVPILHFFLSGKLTDMERGWYTSVGAGITLTMLVNVATPHVGPVLAAYVILPVKRGIQQFTTVTSSEMNALFANPAFDISVRYPVVLNTIFVTFMYAGGMPALLPLGAVSCFLNYAVDKLMLMKLYRVRTAYDQALGNLALTLFPWMLLVHLGFSAWSYGVSSLLESDLLHVAALAQQATSALATVESSLTGQDDANATTSADAAAIDPTEQLHEMLLAQLETVADPTLAQLLGGVLKAYSKIVRVNTFPVFFLFVLVLLYLLLHRVLAPVFHVTVGVMFKFGSLLLGKVRRSRVRVAAAAVGQTAPAFTALFERPLAADEVDGARDDGGKAPAMAKKTVDTARGFQVDAGRGMVICRGADGERLRSWQATSAPVKTYAIEKNPKYTVRR